MTKQDEFVIPPDVEGFWAWDQVHNPHVIYPLEADILIGGTGRGFTRAMSKLGSPLGVVTRMINYYAYLTMFPTDASRFAPEAMAKYQQAAIDIMPTIGPRWDNEWLPAMKPELLAAQKRDYTKMSDQELLDIFDKMIAAMDDRWEVHGYILYSFVAAGRFADFYNEVMGSEDNHEGYEALQGFETMALHSTRGLWRLSRDAQANPELKAIFDTTPPDQLEAKLKATPAAKDFLKQLSEYLEEFGWRSDSVYSLHLPSWREDPNIPLSAIQGYISMDEAHGPEAQYQTAVDRREKLLAEVRAKIANDPERQKKFQEVYDGAIDFNRIVEDHNHWIDQMGDILNRYPALELGKRLVDKGKLAKQEDVFMLRVPEIKEAIAGKDFKDEVAKRHEDRNHWAKIVPPPAIGTPPPSVGEPIEDVIIRFFGTPVEPSSDPQVITGTAASAGTARGPAKVVKSLNEASKLKDGDVLVCEMTLPPWTPLFATASAVVADSGGVLSHCAIVAREYRIPCVVGTGNGTHLIKDGQILTVDGTRGIVRIES